MHGRSGGQSGGPRPEESSSHINDGPVKLTRHLLKKARSNSVVSVSYYFCHKLSAFRSTLPYLYFATGKMTARSEIPDDHAEALEKCHEFIIGLGKPIVLSTFLKAFSEAEPRLTKEVFSEANRMGVFDQYMVPVFGPFDINGVIAFGFGETITADHKLLFCELESAAITHHNRMVRHFHKKKTDVELSKRENSVLTWIARGKSTGEISLILEISKSSVDTYTRRIFEKMGVNTRVEAAISGVTKGLVKPDLGRGSDGAKPL